MKKLNKNIIIIYFLEILAIALLLYLLLLPFYPKLKYIFIKKHYNDTYLSASSEKKDVIETEDVYSPEENNKKNIERIIIPKIGVNVPIIESKSSDYGLSKGAWIDPAGSTPSEGGNTIISAHRFKYLPPSNLTFYNLDKLVVGDEVIAEWRGIEYKYHVKEVKIVPKTEVSILNQTKNDIITLYTCNPIFSQKERLVVVGELIK